MPAGSRTWVTSMGGLYDAATLQALVMKCGFKSVVVGFVFSAPMLRSRLHAGSTIEESPQSFGRTQISREIQRKTHVVVDPHLLTSARPEFQDNANNSILTMGCLWGLVGVDTLQTWTERGIYGKGLSRVQRRS